MDFKLQPVCSFPGTDLTKRHGWVGRVNDAVT